MRFGKLNAGFGAKGTRDGINGSKGLGVTHPGEIAAGPLDA